MDCVMNIRWKARLPEADSNFCGVQVPDQLVSKWDESGRTHEDELSRVITVLNPV